MLPIKFLSDWPNGFVEDYVYLHVYCPGVGADQPLGSNIFQNLKSLVHLPWKIAHLLQVLPFKGHSNNFPIQMHVPPMLTLPEFAIPS